MVSTLRPLYPQGKSAWYPLVRRLGGLQKRAGHGDEEKNSQTLPGREPAIIQPVAQRYTTELSQLLMNNNDDPMELVTYTVIQQDEALIFTSPLSDLRGKFLAFAGFDSFPFPYSLTKRHI
jgi:hypothetical protein